ncbi:leucyl/phenylalanyl-tRNA--protein transferase [Tepidiphilus baoligensis]|uniref:Leucyl/phenylalanyl-tRNA--protein transferase n=1 Tax=Tepidiphilus baoligensis TaxID=2698687 RepID=A0ABX1QNC2_9PROT|nr:leucyl/phenylalanyl-tRNA--protein transferase [Tepidiphilus baoligensis]NMH16719.1 leucyl/phenylalanyl-tRNA--protein transferase [Tepidiphilus baoligensis]
MIPWLDPRLPPRFPSPRLALAEPNGLLAAGGSLAPSWLLEAYRQGIFPWFSEGQPILWWSPAPRLVLEPQRLRVRRSLRKVLRHRGFVTTLDADFPSVIANCARLRPEGTWITPEMIDAYIRLHALGHAHSVETWHEGRLVGGLYGVALGGVFFGESMFHLESDASKVALVRLCAECRARGITLIDCQMSTPHLRSLGAEEISREEFLAQLARLVPERPTPQRWQSELPAVALAEGIFSREPLP